MKLKEAVKVDCVISERLTGLESLTLFGQETYYIVDGDAYLVNPITNKVQDLPEIDINEIFNLDDE